MKIVLEIYEEPKADLRFHTTLVFFPETNKSQVTMLEEAGWKKEQLYHLKTVDEVITAQIFTRHG